MGKSLLKLSAFRYFFFFNEKELCVLSCAYFVSKVEILLATSILL